LAREDSITGVKPQQQTRQAKPPMARVLMHNDDYTSMEFVVEMLEKVFRKSSFDANRIMLAIHHKGVGLCGVYPFEIAETRILLVHRAAKKSGFPLRCSLEEM